MKDCKTEEHLMLKAKYTRIGGVTGFGGTAWSGFEVLRLSLVFD
jgi:hypothetical protein